MFKSLGKLLDASAGFGGGVSPPPVPPPEYFLSANIHRKAEIAMSSILRREGMDVDPQDLVNRSYEIARLMSKKKA